MQDAAFYLGFPGCSSPAGRWRWGVALSAWAVQVQPAGLSSQFHCHYLWDICGTLLTRAVTRAVIMAGWEIPTRLTLYLPSTIQFTVHVWSLCPSATLSIHSPSTPLPYTTLTIHWQFTLPANIRYDKIEGASRSGQNLWFWYHLGVLMCGNFSNSQ